MIIIMFGIMLLIGIIGIVNYIIENIQEKRNKVNE